MPTIPKKPFDPSTIEGLMHFPYRAYCDPEKKLISILGKYGFPLKLAKGDYLRSADFPKNCFLVDRGTMISFVQNPNGSLIQSAYYLDGSMFLQLSALSNVPTNLVYYAKEPSSLLRVSANDLKRMMMADESFFDDIMESVAQKMYATREQQRGAKTLDVRERIYVMLLGFAKDVGEAKADSWIHIGIKLTQQSMSDMLSVNRVTVNTALQDLYDANLVKKDSGYYSIRDVANILKRY